VHIRPVTAVATARPEVGVLVDAPAADVPAVASAMSARGIRVSFAVDHAYSPAWLHAYGDQAVPRLPTGGLVRWLATRGQLHHLIEAMGFRRHFLYASSGPSVGQWWLAHGAGGRLIAGAVRVDDRGDALGLLRPGEVVELTMTSAAQVQPFVDVLARKLNSEHLTAVPVGKLMGDAGAPA
jgi:hypothetical protein